ncbi:MULTISPECIES: hypothetical protein [Methylosinus]|uniref:Right handed beta helix domain-containing protein n=1 Tax=Methylosinus trichosporium (strain ATCC 35070 / NCIMB 11131 / UNIQEM 75 / OB3b) TaxID=595536 RepID=A0A2D2D3N6_METT3|nr:MULTISPECIES: hypothetical protein [Methylosinus]ATQ69585.1 hypothetical protein CQW49_18135 [Methylosinus trichosporium OB3b]OBS54334.1 hypothetical protein A8B73_01130 [Methylosinus sp. 3S-1]
MSSRRLAAGLALAAVLHAAPALAANTVSFVSVTGDDARSCAAPATACRSFQRAHDATSPHGEIIALTPGDFRPLTITKSISVTGVDGAGVFGGASRLVTIIAEPTDVVHLTGLTLDGGSLSNTAVHMGTARSVTLRKCAIRNFMRWGLRTTAVSRALIEDVSVSVIGSDPGLDLHAPTLVRRVVARAAHGSALVAGAGGVTVSESSFADNANGVDAFGPLYMTRSALTGNSVSGFLGDITSAGDNFIRGNGPGGGGTIINIGRQ